MVRHALPIRRYLCPAALSLMTIVFVGGCAGGSSTLPPASNPVPAIAALSPSTLEAGASGATVAINGSGFISTSVAQWNQSSRATTFVSSTQLQVALTTADLATGTIGQITVTNPAPGGGASSASTLTVNNPMPALTGISPSSVTTLAAGAVLTLNGSGFVTASVVMWNGASHPSTFVSATQLQITLTTPDVASAGSAQIVVVNPAPGGGSAAPAPEPILNPTPTISSLNPSSVAVGGQPQTLTVNGSGFVPLSIVQINGVAHPTTFVNATVLTSTLSAADIATPATDQVTVVTAAPGGGVSGPMALTISSYPTPTITGLTPTSIPIGSLDTMIDVSGTGFTPASTAQVNGGASINTTGLNPGELLFTLPAADLTALGPLSITISNPGTATSNAVTITVVVHPVPVLTSLSPSAAAIGGSDFTLSLTGSGFMPQSVVQWNGSPRPTVFGNSNFLTATIPASDIVSLGNSAVTVFTPTPGGGTSAPSTFSTFLSLPNNDLVYDATRKLLWASVPSIAGPSLGNSVVSIDPYTGILGNPIWVGSEPNKLAISGDGTKLWVSFLGSPSARKIDLANGIPTTVELYFPGGWGSNIYATSLAVFPGAPSSVAVAPGAVLYDDSAQRSNVGNAGATYLTFGASANTLYGYNNGLSIFSIDSSGVASTVTPPSSSSYSNDLRYDNGRLYLTSGGVLDGTSGSLLGTFAAVGPVASDSSLGRAFILNSSTVFNNFEQVTAFDESNFVPIGSFSVAGVGQPGNTNPTSLVRWGDDGLAFRTPNQIYILRSALVRDLSASSADMSISISAPASAVTGVHTAVTLTAKNKGPNAVSGATLRETIPSGATLVSAAPSQGTCGVNPAVLCDLGNMPNGSSATVTLVLQFTTSGSVTNSATVGANLPDSNLNNNSASAAITVSGAMYTLLPGLFSLAPQSALAGSPDLTLMVSGSNFSSGSAVNWNNTSLPTTFVNANQLTVTVPSNLLASAGFADVTVSNPSPGGGTSASIPFTVSQSVALDANDIVFDPFTRKIYASVPSTASQVTGNSIVSIDPFTGALGVPIPIGSEPTRLSLSDDGKYLYAVLSGSNAVHRLDLTTLTPGTQFTPLSPLFGPYTPSDLAVMPGNPNVLATVGYSDGIQVWDVTSSGATARTLTNALINDVYEGSVLAWADSTHLYSNDEGINPSSFHRFAVGSTSFAETDSTYLDAVAGTITYGGGLIFADGGAVVDPAPAPPATPKLIGRFYSQGGGFHAVDTATNRIFFLNENFGTVNSRVISAFDTSRFTLLQTTELDGLTGDAFDLIRWGQDGLAFRIAKDFWGNGSGQIVLLHGSAVLPRSSTPNPAPSVSLVFPGSLTANAGNTWLTISGSNFVPGSIATWNGSPRSTVLVNPGQLRVAIPAADLTTPQTNNIQVVNPTPGGGTSSQVAFKVI